MTRFVSPRYFAAMLRQREAMPLLPPLNIYATLPPLYVALMLTISPDAA